MERIVLNLDYNWRFHLGDILCRRLTVTPNHTEVPKQEPQEVPQERTGTTATDAL